MLRLIVFFVSAFWLGLPGAIAQPVDGGHATVELISENVSVPPGETIIAGFHLKMDEGWHVYWRNAGDAGLPPELSVSDDSGVQLDSIGEWIWPIPHELPVVPGEIMDYGYDDEVVLAFPVTIPETTTDTITLSGRLDYLICLDVCIPEVVDVSKTWYLGEPTPDEVSGTLISKWIAKAPTDFSGEAVLDASGEPWAMSLKSTDLAAVRGPLRFFPYDHEIQHAAAQPFSSGTDGATLELTPSGLTPLGETLDGVVVVTEPSGARRGLKVSAPIGEAFAGTAGSASSVKPAAQPVFGGVSIFWLLSAAFLGGLILNLMPCVLPVLSIKVMGVVSAAASGKAGEMRWHGVLYTLGVLVAFLALAAVILAVRSATGTATLGVQLQHPPTVAILALIMFGIGLWLIGAFELGTSVQNTGSSLASRGGGVGAFFTGVLAAVVGAPCVGPFLGAALGTTMTRPAFDVVIVFLVMGLGLALPFLLLSFVPGLHRLFPKPGKWMETLKQLFAFPMFLTAAWLVWVVSTLGGNNAVLWTLIGAVLLGFAVWAFGRSSFFMRSVAAIAFAGSLALPIMYAKLGTASSGQAYEATYQAEEWSPERVDALISEGRPVFVDFTATWCATCQVNKLTTLKTEAVQQAFKRHNVAFLVADFTRKDPVIAKELEAHGRAGVPMYLWYGPGEVSPEILPEILSQNLVIDLVEPN